MFVTLLCFISFSNCTLQNEYKINVYRYIIAKLFLLKGHYISLIDWLHGYVPGLFKYPTRVGLHFYKMFIYRVQILDTVIKFQLKF